MTECGQRGGGSGDGCRGNGGHGSSMAVGAMVMVGYGAGYYGSAGDLWRCVMGWGVLPWCVVAELCSPFPPLRRRQSDTHPLTPAHVHRLQVVSTAVELLGHSWSSVEARRFSCAVPPYARTEPHYPSFLPFSAHHHRRPNIDPYSLSYDSDTTCEPSQPAITVPHRWSFWLLARSLRSERRGPAAPRELASWRAVRKSWSV